MVNLSEKSLIILRQMGWSSTRKIDASIWIESLQSMGYIPFEKAQAFLESFGGLHWKNAPRPTLSQFTLADGTKIFFGCHPSFDFVADDTYDSNSESADYWNNYHFIVSNNLNIFPIGSIRGMETLFIVSDGRLFLSTDYSLVANGVRKNEAGLIFLGDNFIEAINHLTEQCVAYV